MVRVRDESGRLAVRGVCVREQTLHYAVTGYPATKQRWISACARGCYIPSSSHNPRHAKGEICGVICGIAWSRWCLLGKLCILHQRTFLSASGARLLHFGRHCDMRANHLRRTSSSWKSPRTRPCLKIEHSESYSTPTPQL